MKHTYASKNWLGFSLLALALTHCGLRPQQKMIDVDGTNRGVLNGKSVPDKERSKFAPVLELSIKTDTGNASCTATQIGDGVILTAYHCIGAYINESGTQPALNVLPAGTQKWLGEISGEEYETYFPEAEFTISSKVGVDASGNDKIQKTPQPDLAIIKLKKAASINLDGIPTALLPATTLDKTVDDKSPLSIAGFGIAPLGGNSNLATIGILHTGLARISAVESMYYNLQYNPGKEFAAALPGDSGGPLYSLSDQGKFQVHAVASFIRTELDEKKEKIQLIESRYVRLDREPVRKWLAKILGW